jgi:hypothetical protein
MEKTGQGSFMAEAKKQQTAQASQHHSIMNLLPASAALTNSCLQRATQSVTAK